MCMSVCKLKALHHMHAVTPEHRSVWCRGGKGGHGPRERHHLSMLPKHLLGMSVIVCFGVVAISEMNRCSL